VRNPSIAVALEGPKVLQNIASSLGSSYSPCQFMFELVAEHWAEHQLPMISRRNPSKLKTEKSRLMRAQRSWDSSWQ
jgi:hypothetical protein